MSDKCQFCQQTLYEPDIYNCGTMIGASAPETLQCATGYIAALKSQVQKMGEAEIEDEFGPVILDKPDSFEGTWVGELATLRQTVRTLTEALSSADKLLVRCHEWTAGDAQVMVPVQKLRLDIEVWGRRYKEIV